MAHSHFAERRRLITGATIGTATICILGTTAALRPNKLPNSLPVNTKNKLSRPLKPKRHGGIGMNLSPPSYYSNTHPFLNRIRTAGDFAPVCPVNQFGYPIGPRQNEATAWTLFSIEPKTPGIPNRWIVLHNGQGTASLRSQTGIPVTPVSGEGTQRVVFDYNDPTESECRIDLNMNVWPTQVAIVRVDQECLLKRGETFNPAFLENCKQWSVLRFMDWLSTNYHTGETGATDWNNRPSTEYLTWCGSGGVPVEVCAELCVKSDCDMWYNIPFRYERPSWRLAIEHLNKALLNKCLHVEYSNEVWNYSFQQAHDALAEGQRTIVGGKSGGLGTYYGQRCAEIMKDAISIFHGERSRLITHLGVQEVNRQTYLEAERGVRSLGYEVADLIDEVSGTFYIDGGFQGDAAAGVQTTQKDAILSLARAVNDGGPSRTKALDVVFAQIHSGGQAGFGQDGVTIDSHKADSVAWSLLSADRGWSFGFYEGQLYHWSLSSNWTASERKTLIEFVNVIMADLRTGNQILEVLSNDRARFDGVFMVFFDIRANDQRAGVFGSWGTMTSLYEVASIRQRAYQHLQLMDRASGMILRKDGQN